MEEAILMYERNAIVLERYFEKKLGYQDTNNLKENFNNYCELLEKIEQFENEAEEEENASNEFDDISAQLVSIQQTQEKLYKNSPLFFQTSEKKRRAFCPFFHNFQAKIPKRTLNIPIMKHLICFKLKNTNNGLNTICIPCQYLS